jgi:hypothetical protein
MSTFKFRNDINHSFVETLAENEEQCENPSSEQTDLEMGRHYYTTPSSYMEMLKQYHLLLKKRISGIKSKRDRIACSWWVRILLEAARRKLRACVKE